MDETARLVSVQVGQPASYPAEGPGEGRWRSAIVKTPVQGALWLRELGLEGDAQADLRVHGGPTRAANVYPAEHYEVWRQSPGLEGMRGGAFGENFTTQGLLETTVCIGDTFRVGEAVVRVTQPRGPCYKLNRRWHVTDLQQRAEQTGWIGWYFGVVQAGQVQAGASIELLDHPYPRWTIARVWELTRGPADPAALRELIDCPALADGWRATLRKRLAA